MILRFCSFCQRSFNQNSAWTVCTSPLYNNGFNQWEQTVPCLECDLCSGKLGSDIFSWHDVQTQLLLRVKDPLLTNVNRVIKVIVGKVN